MNAGLRYVYQGNVPGEGEANTYRPNCGKLLINWYGYQIRRYDLKGSKCAYCGLKIDGMWPEWQNICL